MRNVLVCKELCHHAPMVKALHSVRHAWRRDLADVRRAAGKCLIFKAMSPGDRCRPRGDRAMASASRVHEMKSCETMTP